MPQIKDHKSLGQMFLLVLFVSIFFPLFPIIFGNSPIHLVPINIVLGFMLFIINSKFNLKMNTLFLGWLLVFCIQLVLLTVSLMLDGINHGAGFSGMFGIFKPLYTLFFLYVGYSLAFSYEKFEDLIDAYFKVVLVITIAVAFYEMFLIQDGSVFYFLFKREERYILDGKSTSWFGVSYYHSFYFLLFFIHYFLSYIRESKEMAPLIASFVLVVVSQSRTLILSMFIFIFLVVLFELIKRPKFVKKLGVLIFLCIALFAFYREDIVEKLWYVFIIVESFIDSGFLEFILSGSVKVRIDQVASSIDVQYYVYGGGLGRNGVPLESVYASYFYRFGVVWSIFFILFYMSIGSCLIYKAKRRMLFNSVGLFWLMTPISMFASPMIDFPKINFVLFVITGYLIGHITPNSSMFLLRSFGVPDTRNNGVVCRGLNYLANKKPR